ncbi:MAG: hypothetical protein V4760_01075 [Bdellovibrionota bacterium]
MKLRPWLVLLAFVLPSVSHARAFDLKNERVAPFIRGTFGYCLAGTTAFGGSSGADITFDKSANFATGGEFGVVVEGPSLGMRISVEYLIPKQLTSAEGKDQAGATQFSMESKMGVLIPQVNFDFNMKTTNVSRYFVGGGVGMATLTLENQFTQSAGSSYSALGNFTENGTGSTVGGQVYAGYETHFTDTVSISFDVGYRYYNVTTINSTKSQTSFTGSQVEGQPLKNHDGTDRQVNLSGPYGALGFRFYL